MTDKQFRFARTSQCYCLGQRENACSKANCTLTFSTMGAFKPGSDDSQASMAIDPQTIQLESVLSVGLVASLFQPLDYHGRFLIAPPGSSWCVWPTDASTLPKRPVRSRSRWAT